MTKDKDLLQYCKDKKLPVEEMTIKDFQSIENMLDFQLYKLRLEFKCLGLEILNAMKKIEHRKKSCKNFKCK
jgi:hypothetical protein